MKVDWDAYKDCQGGIDDDTHTCAIVVYQNEDGNCRHFACEGLHEDCGEIVAVEEL